MAAESAGELVAAWCGIAALCSIHTRPSDDVSLRSGHRLLLLSCSRCLLIAALIAGSSQCQRAVQCRAVWHTRGMRIGVERGGDGANRAETAMGCQRGTKSRRWWAENRGEGGQDAIELLGRVGSLLLLSCG